jgi:hypothetical protein
MTHEPEHGESGTDNAVGESAIQPLRPEEARLIRGGVHPAIAISLFVGGIIAAKAVDQMIPPAGVGGPKWFRNPTWKKVAEGAKRGAKAPS